MSVHHIEQAYDITLAGKPYLSAGEQTSGHHRPSYMALDSQQLEMSK